MNLKLIVIGKTDEKFLEEGIDKYFKRIKHYINFEFIKIKDIKNTKNLSENNQKNLECEKILEHLNSSDFVILLDENGAEYSSKKFAEYISKQMLTGIKNIIFVIGGPYGFSPELYKRANHQISISKMTFSHQIIRLIFAEQLYRAFTIINNEPYHHE
ncbi:MAG: 23S rRNA (pseudouridine(1915)-N(3))-methyltransferase RlmH [Bacteroidales bacterium]|jgi:23S rRNA (pseudouridine1915-N3)-methyltransferase|nr:23S rRNA (pseudouridine(1915)-N(3))-methyltransferase RlmH [Bacteroidales bacterium]